MNEALQTDPRVLDPTVLRGLERAVADVQGVRTGQVTATEHSPGQVVVRVEGVPDEQYVTITVAQRPASPDAMHWTPGDGSDG